MARRFLRPSLSNKSGDVYRGARVFFYEHDTTDEIDLYAAETGGTVLAQPLVTDNKGQVETWADWSGEIDVTWTDTGNTYLPNGQRVSFTDFTQLVPAGGDGVTAEEVSVEGGTNVQAALEDLGLAIGAWNAATDPEQDLFYKPGLNIISPDGQLQAIRLQRTFDERAATGGTYAYAGLESTYNYGAAATPARGTVHAVTAVGDLIESDTATSEMAALVGALRAAAGVRGNLWVVDLGLQGPIGTQPDALLGLTMFLNNYYNGSPLGAPSHGLAAVTRPGTGPVLAPPWSTSPSYPNDYGLVVCGYTNGASGSIGWTVGVQVGGNATKWMTPGERSRIDTGIVVEDWMTRALLVKARHTSSGVSSTPAVEVRRRDNQTTVDLARFTSEDGATVLAAVRGDGRVKVANATAADDALNASILGPGYVSGDRIMAPFGTNSTRTTAEGNLFLVPLFIRSPVTVDRMFVEVSTAGGGSTVIRLGIWNHDSSTGKPGTLLLDAGAVSGLVPAEVGATISQALTPGWVWLGCAAQTVTGSPVVRGFTGGGQAILPPSGPISSTLSQPGCLFTSGVTGAFGTLVGASYGAPGTTSPFIQLRVA